MPHPIAAGAPIGQLAEKGLQAGEGLEGWINVRLERAKGFEPSTLTLAT
jgi:hypothetical protein